MPSYMILTLQRDHEHLCKIYVALSIICMANAYKYLVNQLVGRLNQQINSFESGSQTRLGLNLRNSRWKQDEDAWYK